MGERSKFIGELGEDLASSFFDKLKWSHAGAWNQDIPCQNTEHKTAKSEQAKKTHGIDGVYCYTNPYTANDDLILVEAKAVSWIRKENITKSEVTLGKQLNRYVDEVIEKAACAQRSQEFRNLYGFEKGWGLTKVALTYYVHDSFTRALMHQVRKKIALASNESNVPVFIISNDILERTLSVLKFVEVEALKLKATRVSYLFPQMQMKKPNAFWEPYIPIEFLFSAFYVCRMESPEGERNYIFYQGSYSLEAIKRLCAALGRLNVLAFGNLTLVSVEIPNIETDRHGLEAIKTAGEVTVSGQKVTLDFKQIDTVTPRFTLKG